MTRVCLLGPEESNIRAELLAYETARSALQQYTLSEPFANSIAVETVSLGAAMSLLNDLDWYLARVADAALVLEPSVSDEEWLSRDLARAVRNSDLEPEETADYLKVFGVVDGALVEPMYVTRRDGDIPEYDLRDIEETVVVRVTESEFGGPVG